MNLETVRLRVADLGFADGALTREIIGSDRDRDIFGHPAPFTGGRYKHLGLELCPPRSGLSSVCNTMTNLLASACSWE